MQYLGSGTTNDGNTSRRFFKDPIKSAEITGLNVDLIKRFAIILRTISSGYNIDADKFDNYATQTANLFVNLYPWYYMPVSIHKLLIHGADVIRHALVPLGILIF